jgi:hypothetical protein
VRTVTYFLLGAQVEDVAHRQQHDAVALGERKVFARRRGGLLQLRVFRDRGLLQRAGEALGAHRLEQIVERVQLERLHRVPVVRREKMMRGGCSSRARCRATSRPPMPGHLDVEEQDLRPARRQQVDRPRRRLRASPTTRVGNCGAMSSSSV